MADDHMSLREAAEMLGVHYMTAYRYVRLGKLPARKVGSAWLVERADVETLLAPPPAPVVKGAAQWDRRMEARLVAGDEAGAWGIIESAMSAGTDPARVYTEILGPALRSIGARWAEGELEIAEEHRASAVAARLVGRLGPWFARPGRTKGAVVVTTPPGERHMLGAAMLADVIRGAGYDVVDLGADVPVESTASVAATVPRLKAVCVSVVNSGQGDVVAGLVATVRRAAPGALIMLGGPGIASEGTATELGADAWAQDAVAALEHLEQAGGGG